MRLPAGAGRLTTRARLTARPARGGQHTESDGVHLRLRRFRARKQHQRHARAQNNSPRFRFGKIHDRTVQNVSRLYIRRDENVRVLHDGAGDALAFRRELAEARIQRDGAST